MNKTTQVAAKTNGKTNGKTAEEKKTPPIAKTTTKGKGTQKQIAEKKTTPDKSTKGKKTPAKKTPAVEATSERHYGLSKEQIAEMKAAKERNPYREGSSYWLVVQTLDSLGINKLHAAEAFLKAYVAETDKKQLTAFKSKEKRSDNGLDWKGRILQNAFVVTRKDYGKKLRDLGWEVRQQTEDGNKSFGLFRLAK